MLEAIAGVMGYGMETANKYKIKNSLGQVAPDSFVFWFLWLLIIMAPDFYGSWFFYILSSAPE